MVCALKTKSHKFNFAVHLEANVGRIAGWAEAIALGMAASYGDTSKDRYCPKTVALLLQYPFHV
jgi:cytidine deaminase